MRIAFAGDWHANTDWAVKAIEHARQDGAEIILHLGDYGYNFTPTFRNKVELALAQAHINLLFVDGNHENFAWLLSQPTMDDGRRRISQHVYHLPRGYRWEWDGIRFMAVGGAYSVDRKWRRINHSWWSEEVLTDEQIEKACVGDKVDVLVSHDCPSGVIIPGLEDGPQMFPPLEILRAEEHRTQFRKIVDAVQPKQIWHGHYHRRYDSMVDFGYGPVEVHGLDMDATSLEENVMLVDLRSPVQPDRVSDRVGVGVIDEDPHSIRDNSVDRDVRG